MKPHIRKEGLFWVCSVRSMDSAGGRGEYVGTNPVRAYGNWMKYFGQWAIGAIQLMNSVNGGSLFGKAPRA